MKQVDNPASEVSFQSNVYWRSPLVLRAFSGIAHNLLGEVSIQSFLTKVWFYVTLVRAHLDCVTLGHWEIR